MVPAPPNGSLKKEGTLLINKDWEMDIGMELTNAQARKELALLLNSLTWRDTKASRLEFN